MGHPFALLLPALIPSWRFFDRIAPSPRIEFALLPAPGMVDSDFWQEFRPKPRRLGAFGMLARLLWNSRGNETLFLLSCAERLMAEQDGGHAREIARRIQADLARRTVDMRATPYLQFRLPFVSRQGAALRRDIAYVSPVYRLDRLGLGETE